MSRRALIRAIDPAAAADRIRTRADGFVIHTQTGGSMRFIGEVVALTHDCELGSEGERAVVVKLEGIYMTLVFFDREPQRRQAVTGADYRFVRPT